jgi:hypothetical protein
MDEENDNRESEKQVPATQWHSVNKGMFQQFKIMDLENVVDRKVTQRPFAE